MSRTRWRASHPSWFFEHRLQLFHLLGLSHENRIRKTLQVHVSHVAMTSGLYQAGIRLWDAICMVSGSPHIGVFVCRINGSRTASKPATPAPPPVNDAERHASTRRRHTCGMPRARRSSGNNGGRSIAMETPTPIVSRARAETTSDNRERVAGASMLRAGVWFSLAEAMPLEGLATQANAQRGAVLSCRKSRASFEKNAEERSANRRPRGRGKLTPFGRAIVANDC